MPQAATAKADATSASSAAAPGMTSEEAAEVLSALEEAACPARVSFVARDREKETGDQIQTHRSLRATKNWRRRSLHWRGTQRVQ